MPSGTDLLWGARNKSWVVVAACLCSARRAIAALHPKRAHDATPVTNTTHLNLFQCANNPRPRHSKEWPADLFRRWRGLATGTEPGFD